MVRLARGLRELADRQAALLQALRGGLHLVRIEQDLARPRSAGTGSISVSSMAASKSSGSLGAGWKMRCVTSRMR